MIHFSSQCRMHFPILITRWAFSQVPSSLHKLNYVNYLSEKFIWTIYFSIKPYLNISLRYTSLSLDSSIKEVDYCSIFVSGFGLPSNLDKHTMWKFLKGLYWSKCKFRFHFHRNNYFSVNFPFLIYSDEFRLNYFRIFLKRNYRLYNIIDLEWCTHKEKEVVRRPRSEYM